MSEHHPDLPPDVARLLEAERDESLPSDDVARMRARLYAAIGGHGGGGEDGGGPAAPDGGAGQQTVEPGGAPAPGSASMLTNAVFAGKSSLAALTVGLLVGGVGGVMGTLAWMDEPPGKEDVSHPSGRTDRGPASPAPEGSRSLAPAPSGGAATEGGHAGPADVDAPAPGTHERPAGPSNATAPEHSASRRKNAAERVEPDRPEGNRDSLARERRLVDAARTAIREGHHAEALAVLERHASTFPEGSLSEERSALEIRALLGLGRDDDARRSVARFRARYPDSIFWPALEARLSQLE